MDHRLVGDGDWSWLGCLIIVGLLLAEIVYSLWILAELLT